PASGVLGVTRVHYMLTTGRVTSKCGAGEWALTVCEPEWRRLLEECLRIRNRPTKASLYRDPFTRRRQALAFMDLLMTADEETYGP
ncbi:MAG TPA: aminoglycoside adenylyltransferase domain-containing protein, partial [Lapillicoccus sp.]|nr:aminoglycoside adenylyltransferase domain-containing protein [Lapillicoccus sp.]